MTDNPNPMTLTPVTVGMTYKGRTYAPMVIESISQPLTSPIDSTGKFVEMIVHITISSLTALDSKDWQNIERKIL